MKNIFIIITALFLFNSCSPSPEYGKKVLNLDNFDFKLNLDKFFGDENVFRGKSDYSVSAEEQSIHEGTIQQNYIQYSTRSMSKERPLASFAGVKFESLGLCSDENDEKVLLVSGQTDYATPADIAKIIDQLNKELGEAEIKDIGGNGDELILKWVKGDKVGIFSIKIPFTLEGISGSENNAGYFSQGEDEQKKEMFTSAIYQQLKDKMKEMKEVECTLFFSKADFDKALDKAGSYSGDLTSYR
ncbi:hypothetical protein KRE40_11795 [Elizabethkingia meningoseptica]|uniref:hypothetical protein n=1 Tax=Elizabethkingia meningoseptica TaxID=238 RepID=UPI0008421A1F|nr:hypothetical protein [Elizabethkingia meningoseptica]EJK5329872.1 hypothetical protein [Elizabethkingia meningoseptica]MDE5439117.1 hypothetical protein [Elizabethkingia meningoseptica]MDE5468682.1 hypothetical protein [Elizabethkingia meningoseptica]MDE5475994.1 hypothetical protein [Elizabethkingia meningoseptica]MDE5478929.1 hypothetical protein [Elizabethkingia meningoseptica]